MPTLVLLDRSLSMNRPIHNNDDDSCTTRLSLAKEGLQTLFAYFETVFPSEYVSLVSFSSDCQLMYPFSKYHKEIREALDLVTSEDRTDLSSALHFVTDTVSKEWGMFVPIQV